MICRSGKEFLFCRTFVVQMLVAQGQRGGRTEQHGYGWIDGIQVTENLRIILDAIIINVGRDAVAKQHYLVVILFSLISVAPGTVRILSAIPCIA